jgi:hypothetical protein
MQTTASKAMPESFVSIGQATALVQAMPADIRRAANELGIQPAVKINLIDHFAESDLQRIAEHLRSQPTATTQPPKQHTGTKCLHE